MTALVVGGASGLGLATVSALVQRGEHVVVADRDEAGLDRLADHHGSSVTAAPTDVTDAAQVAAAAAATVPHGPLTIVVHTVGAPTAGRVVSRDGRPHDPAELRRGIEVNLLGALFVLTQSAAVMAQAPAGPSGRGIIITTASVAAWDGQVGQLAYGAAKGAVAAATLPAARDLAHLGIRVMSIAPGTFDTPMLRSLAKPLRERMAADIPFPARSGRPEEFAALVLHLVDNPYLNGEVIRLDAALRLPPR